MTRLPGGVAGPAAGASVRKPNRLWFLALGIALVLQLVVLYWPTAPAGPPVTGLDKLIHIAVFAAPALAALMAGLSAPWVLGILAVQAPVSELVQHFALPHRSGDPLDMMADLAGLALGSLAYLVWNRRQS
jgi:hypothetical protein